MGSCFGTTSWQVKDGKQEEFVERWTSFLNWTRETQNGLKAAQLVADEQDRQRFLSVGEWHDSAARQAWEAEPRFMELVMPCLEVCDDVQSSQYEVRVTV